MNRQVHAFTRRIVLAIFALHGTANAAPPANDSPPNEPKAIVEALIGRDFRNMSRYTGGHELFEYKPIFESYPPYDIERLDKPVGATTTREVQPTFGKCTQEMLVKDIRVTKVQYAQDPTSSVNQPVGLTSEVYVTVEAEVLALRLFNPDQIPADRRCSWLGLEVRNMQTGKKEAYFDHADDSDALLRMMKQFGTLKGDYVVVDPHRRQWSYGIHLLLPRSGKGQRRHYDHTLPMGQRKYVDAVEPRWLIQEPFPPRAVQLSEAIKWLARRLKGIRAQALTSCLNSIERNTGEKRSIVKMEHEACKVDPWVQANLGWERSFQWEIETLQLIKMGRAR